MRLRALVVQCAPLMHFHARPGAGQAGGARRGCPNREHRTRTGARSRARSQRRSTCRMRPAPSQPPAPPALQSMGKKDKAHGMWFVISCLAAAYQSTPEKQTDAYISSYVSAMCQLCSSCMAAMWQQDALGRKVIKGQDPWGKSPWAVVQLARQTGVHECAGTAGGCARLSASSAHTSGERPSPTNGNRPHPPPLAAVRLASPPPQREHPAMSAISVCQSAPRGKVHLCCESKPCG